ncbi:hypothetical protein H072_5326 [Dactylellina haptotyla CBS 200.50]|uniref:Secreted protein n=1 Tax=Dactylellina haptotyla (strain CBS 200.50) TaxID=1284197 RepID=S8AI54_DACHA|nr:hypothetical protein H072_5326 [Dactylellina haptotyla CBS 200.50]
MHFVSLQFSALLSLFVLMAMIILPDMGVAAPVPEPEPKSVYRTCVRVVVRTRIRIIVNGSTSTSTASRTSTRCVTSTAAGVAPRTLATGIPAIEIMEDA